MPISPRRRPIDDDVTTARAVAPLGDLVRLAEPEFFMSYPFEIFARMRAEAPVYWSERDQMWALTKYEDIRTVSKTPKLFSNRFGLVSAQCALEGDGLPEVDDPITGCPMPRRAVQRGELRQRGDSLVMVDPPRHTFLRKLASYAFTPKAIAMLEEHVAELAILLVDQIEPGVEVDFVDTVAAPVPMRVIAEMLGVSIALIDDFRRWSDAFIELGEINEARDERDTEAYVQAATEFAEYFTAELQDRVANPKDDLLSALAHADDNGEPLSIDSQLAMTFVLLTAGNETTRGLLSNAAKLLFDHPEQRTLLAADPSLMPNAVEEFLRFQSPVTHMCRTALDDTEIRGQRIARGDYIVLLYPAANHDEEIWDRSEEFDVTRTPDPQHLAFGFAEHFCLGASLARREIRLVLNELLRRYPNYEILTEQPERTRAHMTPGIKRMPVVFNP
jgi:cytochrome P450